MVRKRNNSEETAIAAPRLTRLRRNLEEETDPESTLIEMSARSSKTAKTPSTGRRQNRQKKNITANEELATSTRSLRVRVLKSSSDSDTENKAVGEPKRKNNPEESIGADSYPTRSRTRKEGTGTIQDSIIVENKAEQPKRQSKKKRILTAADNTLTEIQSPSKTVQKSTRSQAKIVSTIVNQIPDTQGIKTEKNNVNSPTEINKKSSSLRRIVETPRKVSPRKNSSSLLKTASDTVTPESSPMLVNLTPHRSSKTPKKSPMNIGSPKTHSQSPLRLSKTPRKLTIGVESPATSDKSSVSLTNGSPTLVNSLDGNSTRDPFVLMTDFKKEASLMADKSSELNSTSEDLPSFVSTAKLKLRKPARDKLIADNSPSTSSSVSSTSKRKKSPSKKPGTLGSKIRKSPIKTPALINKTPKRTPPNLGLSNRANPESPKRPKSTTKKRSPITASGTPLRPITERKEGLSAKSGVTESAIAPKKMKILLELANESPESTPRGRIRRSLNLTPDFIKFSSSSTSSPILTPKRRGQASTSPAVFAGVFEKPKMLLDESLELIDGSEFMNVSDDVFSKNSVGPTDETYELSKSNSNEEKKEGEKSSEILEKTEVDNATYELAEPKTPSLKKKSRKRSLSNVEPEKCTPEAKRRCRVRFASSTKEKTPGSATNSTEKSLPAVKTPAKRRIACGISKSTIASWSSSIKEKISDSVTNSTKKSSPAVNISAKRKIAGGLSTSTLGLDNARRRSRSLTKIDNKSVVKRRSISASDLSNKTPKLDQKTQDSVNRLSRPRQSISSALKLDVKPPVPRKVPNFAQIHQKKFAEMESLVDAKERVAKRHEELNAQPSTSTASQSSSTAAPPAVEPEPAKGQVPPNEENGVFNRFGFRLRKADALKLISKKPVGASIKDRQESNRSILKGVRTNRRFELMMKARKSKQP